MTQPPQGIWVADARPCFVPITWLFWPSQQTEKAQQGALGGRGCECWNLLLQIPVERVEGLLLWRDPYASAKVFGAGLYMLICLRHLVCGERSLNTMAEISCPPRGTHRGTSTAMPACLAQRPEDMHGCHGRLAREALTCVCQQVCCSPSMALCIRCAISAAARCLCLTVLGELQPEQGALHAVVVSDGPAKLKGRR